MKKRILFYTPKRWKNLIQNIDELSTDKQRRKLKEFCPTLCVQRHDSVIILSELLEAIVNALEDIKLWDGKDTSPGVCLLLNSIRQAEFLASLMSAECLLSFTIE